MSCTICGESGHNRSKCPKRGQDQRNSKGPLTYTLALILFVYLSVLLLALPQISQYDLGVPVFVVYLISSVFAAVLLFGTLHSSASVSGTQWGLYFELGGAAAFFAIVLGGGLYFEHAQRRGPFTVTIYLVSAEKQQTTVKRDGEITLFTNPPRRQSFHNGVAEFRELPIEVNGQDVAYSIDVNGYELSPQSPKLINLKARSTVMLTVTSMPSPHMGNNGPSIQQANAAVAEASSDKTTYEDHTPANSMLTSSTSMQRLGPAVSPSAPEHIRRLAIDLDDVIKECAAISSRDDRISKLTSVLKANETELASIVDPSIVSRVAALNYVLSMEYEGKYNHSMARDALERQFVELMKIYDKNPQFRYDPGLPTIALWVARNRVRWAFAVMAQNNGVPDEDSQIAIRQQLELATSAMKTLPINNDPMLALNWIPICSALLSNGDIKEAKAVLREAISSVGEPTTERAESSGRRLFFGIYFMLTAVIAAEERQCEQALTAIARSESYFGSDEAPLAELFADPSGAIGVVYLLIARASQTDKDIMAALDSALKHLERGDQCEDCQYAWACALSKKAQYVSDPERSNLINQSTSKLKWVLERFADLPFRVRVSAISKDPFLRLALETEDAQSTISSYKWRGIPWNPLPVPPAIPFIWEAEFWHIAIPLERVRTTRLSGDERILRSAE